MVHKYALLLARASFAPVSETQMMLEVNNPTKR
jgi:hypothetical protein